MRSVFYPFFAIIFLGALSTLSAEKVTLEQLPLPVKATVQKQLAEGRLLEVEKDDDEQDISFLVRFTNKTGATRELTVGEDGGLLTLEIGLEEAPAPVQKTIRSQAAQNKIKLIDEAFEDGEISYEVDVETVDGTPRTFSVDAAGKLTRVQIGLENLPAAVRKTMDANLLGGKLVEAHKLIDDADISFEGDVDHDGKVRDIIVAADGKLESVELSMAEVTVAARKTIESKVGNGRVTRVEKSTQEKQGVMPYEVEARKDGKLIRFSVGPRGRFLGMEE